MGFVELDLPTTQDELLETAIANLQVKFPGWVPNEAHLEVALLEEKARIAAILMVLATDVSTEIFRKFGTDLLGLPSIDGEGSSLNVTITAVDDAGYSMAAGSKIGRRVSGDEIDVFTLLADAIVLPGSTTATNVVVQAEEIGSRLNGIASGTEFEMVEPTLAWVDSIESTSVSGGGVDAETDQEYLDRLAERLKLMSSRLILPHDFEIMARDVEGVYRALALDGYDPDTDTDDNERTIAVAAVDENGDALDAGTKTELDALFQAEREVNFVVKIMDPEYTDIAVVFTGVAMDGYDAATVEAAAEQAVADFLDPATWGDRLDGSPPEWELIDKVRFQDVVTVLNNVEGFSHYTALTVNAGTADVTLSGRAPLPSRVEGSGSTVSGTVT